MTDESAASTAGGTEGRAIRKATLAKTAAGEQPHCRRHARLAAAIGTGIVVAASVAACGGGTTTVTKTSQASSIALAITSPRSGQTVNNATVVVSGTVTPAGAQVEVDGATAQSGQGKWLQTVKLPLGTDRVSVTASSKGLAPTTQTVMIKRPSPQRAAAVKSPDSGKTTTSSGATPTLGGSCGNGIQVNSTGITTCDFATSMRNTFERNGPGSYPVYARATGKWYPVTCSIINSGEIECTDQTGALAVFPG
jgi:Glucodextranase, domain B